MNKQIAPLIIFTYKRHDALKILIESLLKCNLVSETPLYIFSDGPKIAGDIALVNQVRDFIKQIKGFATIEYFFSETNEGLADSIISGVSKVLNSHDNVIVLEDDLIVTENFLVFMNKALNKYENNNKVFSISGYSFDLGNSNNNVGDTYFLNRGWSWGWASWKDRWNSVDWDVKDYAEFANNIKQQKEFNKGGSDLTGMLRKQMVNKLDSWAIRWFYAQFKMDGLTLYPKNSKIVNNGFDSLATHTTGSNSRYIPKIDNTLKEEFIFPENVETDIYFQKAFQRKMGISSRIKSKMNTIILGIFNKTN